MKVSELLEHTADDTIIAFAHLDAQNIGYEFRADNVPSTVQNQTVCEISAEDNILSVIVC